jgi:hypothetical protein
VESYDEKSDVIGIRISKEFLTTLNSEMDVDSEGAVSATNNGLPTFDDLLIIPRSQLAPIRVIESQQQ